MKLGECKLCLELRQLEESHIVSGFVYRWMKETSGTGFLRFGNNMNLRSQDGLKEYWLCSECEDLFNVGETEFARNVFYPLTSGKTSQFEYQEWLLKFAVSLSWRALLYFREIGELKHFPETLQQEANLALYTWSEFLLNRQPHPGKYEQHLLPLDEIVDYSVQDMPSNINRYLLRSVAIDAVCSDKDAYVYVKLPQLEHFH